MSQNNINPPSPTNSDKFSLLSTLDFKTIDEMDPSLAEGHRIVFSKEIPVELRNSIVAGQGNGNQDADEIGSLEALRVKILQLVDSPDQNIANIRIELSSESDLFLHYTFNLNPEDYDDLRREQKLMIEFDMFPRVLSKMLQACVKEPESFLTIFHMDNTGTGVLNFVQNMEYKFVDLLSLRFQMSPEHITRQHISFRYNSLRSRLAIMHSKLQDVNNLVKLKQPSLLLQLQRNSRSTNALLSPNRPEHSSSQPSMASPLNQHTILGGRK
uniref:Spindle assembly abnormal protein 6 N-terminal domain-containing protein n=1 Tax=Percolomonas cosmopolitus TaxID=63605 RepID=A0A7S1KQ64_9EUKA